MLLEEAEKGQITGTHTSRGLYQRGLSVFYAQFFFWVKGSVWGRGNAGSFGTLWRGYFMNAKQSLRHL